MKKTRRYKSVYYKIIIIYAIINILLIICIQEMGVYAKDRLEQEYINSVTESFKFQVKSLETDLLYAKNIQDIIINDHRVKWLIYQSPVESVYNVYSVMQEVQDLLIALKGTNPIIEDIGVYISSLNEVISCQKGWIRDIEPIDISTINQEKFILAYNEEFYLLSIPLTVNGKYNSFSYIKINDKEINQVIKNIQDLLIGAEVGIFQDNVLLYKTELFDNDRMTNLIVDNQKSEKVSKIEYNNEKSFLLQTNLISSRIKVWMYFSSRNILTSISKFNQIFKICILISTGALGIFIIYTYYIINKPLKKLVELMNLIKKNNLDVDVTYNANDQFKYIFEGFKDMIESLKSYIEKTYEQELELNKSELKQLQAQINPHFLYNCFFNISKMCKIEDSENAMVLSQKLAKYYMFITRNGNDCVKLEEEYEHTKVYLDIQSIRFGSRVDIQVDEIPDELKNMQVPRIILQPLVENCYKYVFEKIGEEGKIYIGIEGEKGQYIKISVQDNGSLIKNEEIDELNNSLVEDNKRKETTGLFNVNRRLKLKFGQKSGLRVERGVLGGLKVQVLIVMGEDKGV